MVGKNLVGLFISGGEVKLLQSYYKVFNQVCQYRMRNEFIIFKYELVDKKYKNDL